MKRIGIGSCLNGNWPGQTISPHISKYPADVFLFMGDNGYYDRVSQGTCTNLSNSLADLKSEANRICHSKFFLNQTLPKAMRNATTTYYMYDDHEMLNDWRNSVENVESELGISGVTLTDIAEIKAAFALTWDAYYKVLNPPNTDSGIDSDARYFRFTLGDAEVFVLDGIFYKTSHIATDTVYPPNAADRTMLGAAQKQWLKDRLKASTSTFKIIVSGKTIFGDTDLFNKDSWVGYPTEEAELFNYVVAATDWAVPGGVVWTGGDRHNTQVASGVNKVMISAGPLGEGNHALGSNNPDMIYRSLGFGSAMLEIFDDHLQVYALNDFGTKKCSVRVDAGNLTASENSMIVNI